MGPEYCCFLYLDFTNTQSRIEHNINVDLLTYNYPSFVPSKAIKFLVILK